jgi:hypothetical protein
MDWRFALVSTFLFFAAAFVVGAMLDVRNTGPMLSEGVAVELEIDGEVIGPGVECLQFRMVSGEQISLKGSAISQMSIGTPARLTGVFVRMSTCMQGRTFVVSAASEISSGTND